MRAGELNEKITIKRVTRTVNSYGDAIDALSDFNDDAQTVAEMKAEFRCRYISGLRFDDVILWNGGTFDIYSIIPIGRREGMNVRARLRDNEGTLPTT